MYNKQQIFEYIDKTGDCLGIEEINCKVCRQLFFEDTCPISQLAFNKNLSVHEYAIKQTKLYKCEKLLEKYV